LTTPTTAHQQKQLGQHVREMHHGKRPHRCFGLSPPAAAAATAMIVGDTNAPGKKGEHKESTVCKPDEVVFVFIVDYVNVGGPSGPLNSEAS
jgi:hypothetical protein